MLKQAFRYLGIGFFLSALILLGFKYSGKLTELTHLTPTQIETTTDTLSSGSSTDTTKETTTRTTEEKTSSRETEKQTETNTSSVGSDGTISIRVVDGELSSDVAKKLQENGVINSADEFTAYLEANKLSTVIQNGTFSVRKGQTFEELGKILTTYPGN